MSLSGISTIVLRIHDSRNLYNEMLDLEIHYQLFSSDSRAIFGGIEGLMEYISYVHSEMFAVHYLWQTGRAIDCWLKYN